MNRPASDWARTEAFGAGPNRGEGGRNRRRRRMARRAVRGSRGREREVSSSRHLYPTPAESDRSGSTDAGRDPLSSALRGVLPRRRAAGGASPSLRRLPPPLLLTRPARPALNGPELLRVLGFRASRRSSEEGVTGPQAPSAPS